MATWLADERRLYADVKWADPASLRAHRACVIGEGHAMADTVAAAYRGQGWRYRSTTSHPAMVRSRARSPLWNMVRAPSFEHGQASSAGTLGTSSDRRTATFEYVGPGNAGAADVLAVPARQMPQAAR